MFFLLRRLAVLVTTLLLVSFLVFLTPYLTPGDPVRKIVRARTGQLNVDPAVVERLRVDYGLDQPMLVQYGEWLTRAVRGDLGISFTSRAPVMTLIGAALGVTFTLAAVALLLALVLALPLGGIAAVRRGKPIDTAITTVTQAFVAIPEYWMAPVLVLVFALKLGVLPSAGWRGPVSMILPCVVLALRPLSYFTQVARASMIDVLDSPHITAARSRGLSFTETM